MYACVCTRVVCSANIDIFFAFLHDDGAFGFVMQRENVSRNRKENDVRTMRSLTEFNVLGKAEIPRRDVFA